MSFAELLEEQNIDVNDKEEIEKVTLLQKFYSEGYLQGVYDRNPDYEYSLKYRQVVTRVLELFNKTINPVGLEQLEICLDEMDKFRKEHLMM